MSVANRESHHHPFWRASFGAQSFIIYDLGFYPRLTNGRPLRGEHQERRDSIPPKKTEEIKLQYPLA